MKKALKIIGIVLIVLWFGGNLGLYVYVKHFITYQDKKLNMQLASREDMEKAFTFIPEKLTLNNSSLDTDTLHFYNYKLKFPYYKKDIINILLGFHEGKKHGLDYFLLNIKSDSIAAISFFDNSFSDDVDSLREMTFWEKVFDYFYKDKPYRREMYYSKLNDYSIWNLPYNIKLTSLLLHKAAMLDFYDNVYDVQTPYVEGFFGENDIDGKMLYSYDFKIRNKNYSISFLKSKNKKEVMDIIASIQPVDNIDDSYKTINNLYETKDKSNYPEEILLVSMISMKGTNITDLKELLKVIEGKQYHKITIGDVKKEIEYLERQ